MKSSIEAWIYGGKLSHDEQMHVDKRCEGIASCRICRLEAEFGMDFTESDLRSINGNRSRQTD